MRLFIGLVCGVGMVSSAFGGDPTPARAEVIPATAELQGRRAQRQLILTATAPDGTARDLTRAATWTSRRPEVALVSPRGVVTPVADGLAEIVATAEGVEAIAAITVSGMAGPASVSFRNDAIPAFSQAGCNMGSCHGTPTGKGGFRLSLRGYLPEQDFFTLSRESGMRRVNPLAPDSSLILKKPIGESPHEGGLRLQKGTKPHEFLRDWIAEGAKDDPNAPKAVRLEMVLADRVLHHPATTQQLAAVAHYADGSSRDVTAICYYDSSRPDVAEVATDGHVTFKRRGEAAIIAHYLDLVAIAQLTHLTEVPGFSPTPLAENPIDRAVIAKLNRMRIAPSPECSDREFLRRVTLDLIGVLPTPAELEQFLADKDPGRHERAVDRLMLRPEFLDFWALKLADVLRSNGRLIQAKGTNLFTRWIRARLAEGMPIDRFVRELLAASGSAADNPAANYYRISRDPDTAVETTAQLFLGVRIGCAKCHNHPFERWTQDDYYGLGAFFAGVQRKKGRSADDEIIYAGAGEVKQPRTGAVMKPKALGGPVLERPGDRREALAEWLTAADNPFFAKSFVNRVWFHLMGRGIVEPVDDFRDSNPPTNVELLDHLAAQFVADGYDIRKLIRAIATSQTYRRSAEEVPLNRGDDLYFSHAVGKLLPAEVLLDAISTLTDVPSSFANLPAGTRAVQLCDGNMEDAFLKTFGRPARELACECERESDSNLSQALQLIGGATVHDKLRADGGRMARLATGGQPNEAVVRELYQIALSRDPEPAELAAACAHLDKAADRRQATEDLGWVLINSKEFLFRH